VLPPVAEFLQEIYIRQIS